MKRRLLAYWFTVACSMSVAGCAEADVATEGSLLITIPVPEIEGPFDFVASIDFRVLCDTDNDAAPIAEGQLEITGEDTTDTGHTVLLWQAFVAGLPPGDCELRVIATNSEGEISCTARAPVTITVGEVAEWTSPLICDLGN